MTTEPKTPWNPSRRATARVKNPLPAPTVCRNCGSAVQIVNNSDIYGREYGEWPWAYRCVNDLCDSHVTMHPFTAIPAGTLANKSTRRAREKAKEAFTTMWQHKGISRREGYAWLAQQLGIEDVERCHIGWFDPDMCARVVDVCMSAESAEHPTPPRSAR